MDDVKDVRVSQIDWDTDGIEADQLELPAEVTVDCAAERIKDTAHLSDWLSDKYGWNVRSFSCTPTLPKYSDGHVLGLDADGCILQWDGESGQPYNSGETPFFSDAELTTVSFQGEGHPG